MSQQDSHQEEQGGLGKIRRRKEEPNPQIAPYASTAERAIKLWRGDLRLKRHELCKAAEISSRTLGRITTGCVGSLDEWLLQLKHLFHVMNGIAEKLPVGDRKGLKHTWKKLFGPEFPPEPMREDMSEGPTAFDRGAADLGLGWRRPETLPYEERLRHDLAAARAAADRSRERQLLVRLADLYESMACWENAIKQLNALRHPRLTVADHEFVTECSLRLGIAFYRLERWNEATAALQEGLRVVKTHADVLARGKAAMRLYSYLALIKARIPMDRDSARHLEESLTIFDTHVKPLARLHGDVAWATYHHRRATVLLKLKRPRDARKGLIEAIRLRLSHGALAEATRSLHSLGETYQENRPLLAILLWSLCVERCYSFDDFLGTAKAYLQLGMTYRHLWVGAVEKARPVRHAVLMLNEIDFSADELQLLRQLGECEIGRAMEPLPLILHPYRLREVVIEHLEKAKLWAEKAKNDSVREEASNALRDMQKATAKHRLRTED